MLASPAPYSPEGVLLEEFKGKVDELPSFKKGYFQVQDQAAQLTSHLLEPEAEETILEICAGFGGKTTHLAELMGDRGLVIALDISQRRLLSLGENARRLGVNRIIPIVADASKGLFPDILMESGTGTRPISNGSRLCKKLF
jgi:16S rRNA (cytosine967-C5)-methyltransferase